MHAEPRIVGAALHIDAHLVGVAEAEQVDIESARLRKLGRGEDDMPHPHLARDEFGYARGRDERVAVDDAPPAELEPVARGIGAADEFDDMAIFRLVLGRGLDRNASIAQAGNSGVERRLVGIDEPCGVKLLGVALANQHAEGALVHSQAQPAFMVDRLHSQHLLGIGAPRFDIGRIDHDIGQ